MFIFLPRLRESRLERRVPRRDVDRRLLDRDLPRPRDSDLLARERERDLRLVGVRWLASRLRREREWFLLRRADLPRERDADCLQRFRFLSLTDTEAVRVFFTGVGLAADDEDSLRALLFAARPAEPFLLFDAGSASLVTRRTFGATRDEELLLSRFFALSSSLSEDLLRTGSLLSDSFRL